MADDAICPPMPLVRRVARLAVGGEELVLGGEVARVDHALPAGHGPGALLVGEVGDGDRHAEGGHVTTP